jgi:hypothetical protein
MQLGGRSAGEGKGISSRSSMRTESIVRIASAARKTASASSSPKVTTSGRSGQVASSVPLSSGSISTG